jgi:antitoxin component of MazEF toxin-antitoxin module
MSQPTTKQLRRMGASLHVTIPAPIVRQFDLSHGDTVFFDPDATGLRLKFLKLSVMSNLAGITPAEPEAPNQHEASTCPT